MSISTEETKRYFQETAIALRREGFRICILRCPVAAGAVASGH